MNCTAVKQRWNVWRASKWRQITWLACFNALILLLTSCGHTASPGAQSNTTPVQVMFQTTTTYEQAVSAISDLGLRLTLPCRNSVAYTGVGESWIRWTSVEQRDNYSNIGHMLWLTPTSLSPANWQNRLQNLPIFNKFAPIGNLSCNAHIADATPTPTVPYYLLPNQVNTYARITFDNQASAYDVAIAAVSDLGLRLADPCGERHSYSLAFNGTGIIFCYFSLIDRCYNH